VRRWRVGVGFVLEQTGREGEAAVDSPGAVLVIFGAMALFGALVSKLLGYPLAAQDRDKYVWDDRWRAAVLLKIWPLAAVALVVGIVLLVMGA